MDEHIGDPQAVAREDPDGEGNLIGRDAELARVLRVVDAVASADLVASAEAVASADPVLVLLGDVGVGKSALLDRAVHRAETSGTRVLRAEGSESEAKLAFSALHLLLRPVSAETDELPERQRAALHHALGGGTAPAEPDLMLLGVAVVNLLSALGDQEPVLLVLDDAHWFDRASLDVLSFAARRLAGEPVAMLIAARPGDRLPGFAPHWPTLTVGPLDNAAANRLLDQQPRRPTGRTRTRILEQAEGNPLALTELTRAATTPDAAATEQPPAGPLLLPEHLERTFAARLPDLPATTTRALLLLAAMGSVDSVTSGPVLLAGSVHSAASGPALLADSADSATGVPALPPPDTAASAAPVPVLPPIAEDEVWLAAEQAGLIRRTGRGIPRFSHPLIRSAVYHAASADARRAAHLALAELLRAEPDRRAWHLAAATAAPDAAVAAELERTAERARRRGGHAAAATALQRAADLAPRREDGARLLVAAAAQAVLTGDLAWVEELAAAVRARTDDPALLAEAAAQVGRLAALTVRHPVAFSRLADAAEELAADRHRSDTALELLAGATVVRFYSARDAQRQRVEALLGSLPQGDAAQAWLRIWVRAVSNPFDNRAELLSLLPRVAAEARRRPDRLTAFAVMAWLLDETPQAVRAFDEAFDRWGPRGPLPDGLGGAAAWSYVERGRWGRARESCARSGALGATAGLDHAVACAAAVDATVLAYQGDVSTARAQAAHALALIDPLESRSVAVYARRALGAAALGEGAHETAYDQLRAVFEADGTPVHYHASYPALADLAAAAVRSGHRDQATAIVERSARALADNASPRLRALIGRARGLLADPDHAEPYFRAALADPVGEHWPFEHAQALLDLAEWLRRRRRIAEARAPLAEALETFRRLGARPWIERARAEARAAGLDVTDSAPDALAELSPQQQQIIRLAARGLTNREIGEKLFLSPRTVSSHLYRSFPKLGITARSQLRDLVEDALAPADHQG
ncbi:AAA family ATPase [Streptomyces sp. NPDC057877]|uniref:helix-turn-helix transcriptional regulator n=1 Tax=Streptomyces sp. NPDC057877 TaxID=3346269 RepID=UPI0036BEEE45